MSIKYFPNLFQNRSTSFFHCVLLFQDTVNYYRCFSFFQITLDSFNQFWACYEFSLILVALVNFPVILVHFLKSVIRYDFMKTYIMNRFKEKLNSIDFGPKNNPLPPQFRHNRNLGPNLENWDSTRYCLKRHFFEKKGTKNFTNHLCNTFSKCFVLKLLIISQKGAASNWQTHERSRF